MASDEERARQHQDAIAKLRHQVDQGTESAKLMAQMVAGFYQGLVDNGVPVGSAIFITNQYVQQLLPVQQPPPQPQQPQAGGQ